MTAGIKAVIMQTTRKVRTIDSHTGGEPTRVVVGGGLDLGTGTLAEKRQRFQEQFSGFWAAVVNEPRGSDVIVGAVLCEPTEPDCTAGVIFFNNAGALWMCGHGAIGLMVTLQHMGRIQPGTHRLDTPAGVVTAVVHDRARVSVQNVPSYRYQSGVAVEVEGRTVTGDIAWGGNWFFLVKEHDEELRVSNVDRLTEFTSNVATRLREEGITGADGEEIDHIELFGPPESPQNDSRNFVLCPGLAYDRSPCGTGTSAKLACLYADGQLATGQLWKQESIVGSVFSGVVAVEGDRVIPTITGSAWVSAEATLILNPEDPFCLGIRYQ